MKMLSILIPIYNENCVRLVSDLQKQASGLGMPFEILVFDDCSPQRCEENEQLHRFEKVTYRIMPQNLGRSKIRNSLADCAQGDWLLFLDGDSAIVREDFLKCYIESTNRADVIRGGTVYCDKTEIERSQKLHWKYGTKVESDPKGKNPSMFSTNNFLVPKRLFETVRFDESISGYGHEDTLFAFEFEERGFRLLNIDNPVGHLGLKTTEEFLQSTVNAVRNLKRLDAKGCCRKKIGAMKIVKAHTLLQKWHLVGLYGLMFRLFGGLMLWNLRSACPSLHFLNLYKLGVYSTCRID